MSKLFLLSLKIFGFNRLVSGHAVVSSNMHLVVGVENHKELHFQL